MEQAARSAGAVIKLLFADMGAFGKAFYEKDGKEALPVITGVMTQGGVEMAKAMQQMAPVESMKDYGERIMGMGAMMGSEVQPVELSDKVFHFKLTQCPYGLEGTSRELCEAMMATDQKMVSTALGQAVDMKILKSIAAGDKECEVVFTSK